MSNHRPSRRGILAGGLALSAASIAPSAQATARVWPGQIKPPILTQRSIAQLQWQLVEEDGMRLAKTDALERLIILSQPYLFFADAIAFTGDTPAVAGAKLGGTRPDLAVRFVEACLIFRGKVRSMMKDGADTYDEQDFQQLSHELRDLSQTAETLRASDIHDYSANKNIDIVANTPDNAAFLIEGIMAEIAKAQVAPDLIRNDPVLASARLQEALVRVDDSRMAALAGPDIASMSNVIVGILPEIDAALAQGLKKNCADPRYAIHPKLLRADAELGRLKEKIAQTLNAFSSPSASPASTGLSAPRP